MPALGRSPSMTVRQEEGEKPSVANVVASWVGTLPVAAILWYYEYGALAKFTTPGVPILAMQTEPLQSLQGNCLEEYNLLHFTLIGTIAVSIGNLLLQVLTATKPCGGVLVAIVTVLEMALNFFVCYVAISGIELVAFHYDLAAIHECEYLHNVAWWIYVGIAIVLLPTVLCCMFAIVGITLAGKKADARESSTGVVAPAPADVAYKQLAGQPDQSV